MNSIRARREKQEDDLYPKVLNTRRSFLGCDVFEVYSGQTIPKQSLVFEEPHHKEEKPDPVPQPDPAKPGCCKPNDVNRVNNLVDNQMVGKTGSYG